MNMLGHKDIKTTLIYTQLVQFESDEFHSAAAKKIEKKRKLIEADFEYVCTCNDQVVPKAKIVGLLNFR